MAGEGRHLDLKRELDLNDQCTIVELAKDLIAMANSGGGTILVGATETEEPGIDASQLPLFDGARISDRISRYVAPRRVEISHSVRTLPSGRVVIELQVAPAGKYPFVFSRQGNCPGEQRAAFREVRHGARSERAAYEDIVEMIDRATTAVRDEIFQRIDRLVRLPEGYEPIFGLSSGEMLASPAILLDLIEAQRQRHVGSLVDGRNLLWCFLERNAFQLTPGRLSILIRSALRRTPTLFFWLAEHNDAQAVVDILLSSLDDEDRDKSDAKDSILEVAALVAPEQELDEIVSRMRRSQYKHFRDAANRWVDRSVVIAAFRARVERMEWEWRKAVEMDVEDLYTAADGVARQLLEHRTAAPQLSKRLGDLGRVVYVLRHGWPGAPG